MPRFTFRISGGFQNSRFNLMSIVRSGDGSIYSIASIIPKLGLHASFHQSGEMHVGTQNPKIIEKVDLPSFIADIQNKKKILRTTSYNGFPIEEGSAVIGFMSLQQLFTSPPYMLQ
jgi:hypothetical protein